VGGGRSARHTSASEHSSRRHRPSSDTGGTCVIMSTLIRMQHPSICYPSPPVPVSPALFNPFHLTYTHSISLMPIAQSAMHGPRLLNLLWESQSLMPPPPALVRAVGTRLHRRILRQRDPHTILHWRTSNRLHVHAAALAQASSSSIGRAKKSRSGLEPIDTLSLNQRAAQRWCAVR
jgi:hypothetical protein